MNNHPILLLHVSSGTVGLLSGAVALSFRKGSRPHQIAGAVFFISMLTASAAGAFLALKNSEMDNVFGGVLTFYLVATAWVTAKRKDGETGLFDWIGFLVAATIAAAAVTYWVEAAFSSTGTKAGIPAGSYVLPAVVALIAATGDARILLRGAWRCATNRTASLAHVLRIVRRHCVHFSGPPTAISRFALQNTSTPSTRYPAADIDGFLVGPGPVHERIQENCPAVSNPERLTYITRTILSHRPRCTSRIAKSR